MHPFAFCALCRGTALGTVLCTGEKILRLATYFDDHASLAGVTSENNRKIKHKVVDNYRDLVESVDPEDLFDLLFQERIISLEEKKLIQNKSDSTSTQQGTRALLDFLFYSDSEKAFVVFLQALKDNYSNWLLEDD